MDRQTLVRLRLRSLGLEGSPSAQPFDLVRRLGAVQSQDFEPALWSIGQRTAGARRADVEQAVARGAILRTHVLRPTWHFVAGQDIRWLLDLTAPPLLGVVAGYCRRNGLSEATVRRATSRIEGLLAGGRYLTRPEIGAALAGEGMNLTPSHLSFVMMQCELSAVVCSGPPKGKRQTYCLMDERVPSSSPLSGDEALALLVVRYFSSHGPATVRDCSWWSGVPVAEVRRGLEISSSKLEQTSFDGVSYWLGIGELETGDEGNSSVHLLEKFDELVVGYSESKYLVDGSGVGRSLPAGGIYSRKVLVNGQVAGGWASSAGKDGLKITVNLATPADSATHAALEKAVQRFGEFHGTHAGLEE